MSKRVTRRQFLKAGAIAAGAVIGTEILTPVIFTEKMAFDENTSLWAVAQPPKNPPLQEDMEVDVAIIGGGYTGLSAAYHLLQHFPGQTVALFEARGVGHGASGRNGGMVLTQPANEYMVISSGPQTHKQTYDLTLENINDLAALIKTQGLDCDLRRNGSLQVIVKESQVARFEDYHKQAQSLDIPIEFWDRKRTADEIGTDVYYGSLYDPNGGEVHPMKLVHVLKKAAEGAGAYIYEDSPVVELKQGETIQLIVGEGRHTVRARAAVLATNGYTSKLGFFRNSVSAIHTPMALTPPLSESDFAEIGWKNRIAFSDTYNLLYHLSVTPDNRVLIGSGHIDYYFNNGLLFKGDENKIKDLLRKELTRIYPGLSGIDFEYFWTGVLGASLEGAPSVGVMGSHKNIYYGLAYYGHGVNLAPFFGKIIADMYAGEGRKWETMPFYNHRFVPLPPEPLRWAAVRGTIGYYKMEDASG